MASTTRGDDGGERESAMRAGNEPGTPVQRQGEDEVDELFMGANPNEDVADCPPDSRLEALARGLCSQDDPILDHVEHCSSCYKRMRGLGVRT